MRIDSNLNSGGVDGSVSPKRTPSAAQHDAEGVSFSSTDALDTSIKSAPDSRADAVSRARTLINDPQYPSPEVLRGVSNILAVNLGSGGE